MKTYIAVLFAILIAANSYAETPEEQATKWRAYSMGSVRDQDSAAQAYYDGLLQNGTLTATEANSLSVAASLAFSIDTSSAFGLAVVTKLSGLEVGQGDLEYLLIAKETDPARVKILAIGKIHLIDFVSSKASSLGQPSLFTDCATAILGKGASSWRYLEWFKGYLKSLPSDAVRIAALKLEVIGLAEQPKSAGRDAALTDARVRLAVLKELQ